MIRHHKSEFDDFIDSEALPKIVSQIMLRLEYK